MPVSTRLQKRGRVAVQRRVGALLAACAIVVTTAACGDRPTQPGAPSMHDLNRITTEQWQTLAQRTVYFGHQSVGANILDGVREVTAQNAQIPIRIVSGQRTPAPGVLNEFPIGRNEDPDSKNVGFVTATQGALGPRPVLMLKYCYVDVDEETDVQALFERYRETAATLRAQHPDAQIVHFTLPLATEPSKLRYLMNTVRGIPTTRDANARRDEYNRLLRSAFASREPVFDLAALESTRADGTLEYGVFDGRQVPALAPEWSSDGAHLNAAGARRIAEQLLATLASLPAGVPVRDPK